MKSANALVVALFDTWASRGTKRGAPEGFEVAAVTVLLPPTGVSGERKGNCPLALVAVRVCSKFSGYSAACRGLSGGGGEVDVVGRDITGRGSCWSLSGPVDRR
jgi:hypothetical protein